MKYLIYLSLVSGLWAGQSIVTSPSSYVRNLSVPSFSPTHSLPIRVEFEIHDWSGTGYPNACQACGFYSQIPGDGTMHVYSYWDTSGYSYNIPLPGTPNPVYVRLMRDPVALTQSVEAWDYTGTLIYSYAQSIVNAVGSSDGVDVGNMNVSTAFFRVHNTLLPMNSTPPLTSDGTSAIMWWKFDGTLADSAGTNPALMTSGSPSYVATPYQTPVSIVRTAIFPLWGNTSSMRTGVANGLTGNYSYSQADSSSAVTCLWSQLSGPSTLTFTSTTNCAPNVTNVIWGDYNLQLVVTDVNSNTASNSAHIGAVTTDSNWVIQDPDPNVAKIFGKMIAFGHNPWGYMDERALYATTARYAAYNSLGINPPTWQTNFPGTVSYRYGGDTSLNGRGTTLCAPLATGATSATLCDASKLDFTAIPTRILVMSNYYSTSVELHVTGVVGNVVSFDTVTQIVGGTIPNPWPIGTQVGQAKVIGSGTNFLSNICNPANSSWTLSMYYTRADGSSAQTNWTRTGCESDTTLYLANNNHDVSGLNNTVFTGMHYTYSNIPGYTTQYGVDFYGEELAHYALWKRSGLDSAKVAARLIAGQYVSSPYLSGGDGIGISPLLYGGGVIGAIASAVIDPGYVSWSDLVGFGKAALPIADVTTSGGSCNGNDTRDSSYYLSILALLAQFDPDPVRRANWLAGTKLSYTRETTCKQTDNSWANAGYKWGANYPALTLTNGSTNATGTGLSSNMCYGTNTGTITVTNGSANATGTGFVNSNKINIWTGTQLGVYKYSYTDATHITLAALWPFASGTYNYLIENSDNLTVIGNDTNDTTNLQQNYACTYVSSTQLTLNRPWMGANTSTGYLFQSNAPGYNQLVYQMGIKDKQLEWSRQADNTHDWQSLINAESGWMMNNAYDSVTGGLFYTRVLQACEPPTSVPNTPLFDSRTPGCNQSTYGPFLAQARALSAEGGTSFGTYYNNNVTPSNKSYIDTVYGNMFGYAPYTAGGVATSPYQASNLDNVSLANYKYTGFFFGMGMTHRWPAERLTGTGGTTIGTQSNGVAMKGVML